MSVTAGERRIVSVLVADVAGSTAIGEKLGPERSKFLFDEIVRLVQEEVERFGGTVAQLTGDGALALFGAPVAHDDDSERAVRAALAITETLRRYGGEVGPAYGIELAARVAVNTGPVVIPASDEPPDRLYNALGDTVNVAARLQPLGDVVVGPDTARQLSDRFELEELGAVELKGKSAPVSPFRVVCERDERTPAFVSPLVGRERELAQFEQALADLVDGRGAIVVVTGEPGVGKSRLKSEVRDRFADDVRFLEGHAVSYGAETPYWPVRELLRDWLDLGVSDPEARIRLELRAGLAGVLGDAAEDVYPFLATLLGLPLERELASRIRELSRDSVQQQTLDAVRRLTRALASERPVCLVFEDLHWADEATLALIRELMSATEEEAMELVLTYRTEHEHQAWDLAELARRRHRHRFLELTLAPLPLDAAVDLAAGVAGGPLPEAIGAVLAERSGGNPFFLEEALRDLLERGVLRRTNGGVELANGTAELSIPALVQEALQARLDRLSAGAREVVGIASVVGRSFGMPLLERLAPVEVLRPALSELQRLELVVEERRRPAAEYRFRHGLVREVAYGRLVQAARRDLHRAVGEQLEELHRDSLEEVYGVLAHHFSEARDAARSIAYLLKAGDAARAMNAEEEAVELYRRALEFMDRTSDEATARDTLLKIALTHHLALDFEQCRRAYGEAFALDAPAPRRLEPSERIAVTTPPLDSLVPGHSALEHTWELCRSLYRGLVAIGPGLEVVPDIAKSFSVSASGETYRFEIRPDARWSDGVPLTAEDFAFTCRAMRDVAVATAHLLADVRSAVARDRQTLEIVLDGPRSYFLYLAGQPPFYPWPRHLVERLGARWHEQLPLVGNGPFVLTERGEERALFVANPAWQGPRGNVREVEIRGSVDAKYAETRWQAGEDDVLPSFRRLEGGESVVHDDPSMGTAFLGFRADRPPLDDVRVRRALAQAIDRDRAPGLGFSGEPVGTGGFLPPTMPGHSHRVAPPYDPERARSLLAEAGFPDGQGLRALVLAELSWIRGGAAVAEQLGEIGVQATVKTAATLDSCRELIEGEAGAYIWAFGADFPDPGGMIGGLLHDAPAIYRDARVNDLLARARSASSQAGRLAACRELERAWLGEKVALVPLAYRRRVSLTRPWIHGFWQNALAMATYADLVVER